MSRRRRIYEGKAKILYEGPEPGTLIQYFKDDATAFEGCVVIAASRAGPGDQGTRERGQGYQGDARPHQCADQSGAGGE